MHTAKSRAIFFLLEGLNALAASYFSGYLYFLLRDRFGFGGLENLLTAALGGFVYMFAAWQGGRFAQRFGYFTALKTGFAGLVVCLGLGSLVSSLPGVLLVFVGWIALVCFTWPSLEALVSDGVSDEALPRNIGLYNVVWSAAAASMYFVGGALYEGLGPDSIFWLPALMHAGQWLIVLQLGADPIHAPLSATPKAPHPIEPAAFTQPISPQTFLRMVWVAIPFSYAGLTTVVAIIPFLAVRLELSPSEAGVFCSIWMFVRLVAFVVLWHWTGWHYRFRWLVGAFLGLIVGFSFLVLSTHLGVLIAAQAVFGASAGLIYYSSLFYSMDVGDTKGEHGGFHEAMIGAGMCLGPIVGAMSLWLAPQSPNAGSYSITALLACGLAGMIGIRIRRAEPLASLPRAAREAESA